MHTLQLDSHVRSFVDFSNASLSVHSEIFPVWQNITIYMLYLESLLLEWKWKWKWSPQSYLTLCDTNDGSPPGSSFHGIFQVRILERVLFPLPADLPNPGIEPGSPSLQADCLPPEPQRKPLPFIRIIVSKITLSKCQGSHCSFDC